MLLYEFREYFKTIFPIQEVRNRHNVDADEISYFISYRLISFRNSMYLIHRIFIFRRIKNPKNIGF